MGVCVGGCLGGCKGGCVWVVVCGWLCGGFGCAGEGCGGELLTDYTVYSRVEHNARRRRGTRPLPGL